MGSFYTNYTLKGPSQQDITKLLAGRNTVVTPAHGGCVVVFDEQSDEQDQEIISDLASRLSSRFRGPVLAVLNHDEDILWYRLYERGELSDEYDSSPTYFDPDAEPSAPAGGDARRLCGAFGSGDPAAVEAVLRKSSYDDDGYVFASERHSDLVRALGIPEWAVGAAYASFEREEYPDGLIPDTIVRTTSPERQPIAGANSRPRVSVGYSLDFTALWLQARARRRRLWLISGVALVHVTVLRGAS